MLFFMLNRKTPSCLAFPYAKQTVLSKINDLERRVTVQSQSRGWNISSDSDKSDRTRVGGGLGLGGC